ncbi:MAG: hypothetical protein N2315_02195 [Thermanaerothrix sp.]|nr:hypothetical protein [Thermanaerothrix sp.]
MSSGINIGKVPGEASGNLNYLPITSLSVEDLCKSSKEKMVYVGELIEEKAREMAMVLWRSEKIARSFGLSFA